MSTEIKTPTYFAIFDSSDRFVMLTRDYPHSLKPGFTFEILVPKKFLDSYVIAYQEARQKLAEYEREDYDSEEGGGIG